MESKFDFIGVKLVLWGLSLILWSLCVTLQRLRWFCGVCV